MHKTKTEFIQAGSYSDTFVQESASERQQHLKSNIFCDLCQIEEKEIFIQAEAVSE